MKSLFYLNKYFKKYKTSFFLGIFFIVLSNIFKVYSPIVFGDSLDLVKTGLSQKDLQTAEKEELLFKTLQYAGLFVGLYLLSGLFLYFTRKSLIVMSRKIEFDLKNEIYHHYQELNTSFYRKNNTGDLMNRISEDVSRVRMYLGPAIMYSVNLLVQAVLIIPAMLYINPKLTLFALIPLPIMSWLIYLVSKMINRKSEIVQKQLSTLSTFSQEVFSGIRLLKAYNRTKTFNRFFKQEIVDYKSKSLDLVKLDASFQPVMMLLIGISTIITIYIGGLHYMQGEITLGEISSFVIYINMLTWPFAALGWVTSIAQRAAASQTRINEFLHSREYIVNHRSEPQSISGEIEFKNVSFTYPDSGIKALNNISFKINRGKSLAILGKTGSGKTTIANLVSRMYEVEEGQVLIDGKPIEDAHLKSLRKSIGYVPQDVFLFSDTIQNNIAFGESQPDLEKVKEAAKSAVIYDSITSFPGGFETRLGERGINLSGGQKQRISIARAIIRKPQILIFDDCLSAVDTHTEEKILNNLKIEMKSRTNLIISHRVSTVKNADHIIFLENGKIIEEGKHPDLLKKRGFYWSLYKKQLLETKKELNP